MRKIFIILILTVIGTSGLFAQYNEADLKSDMEYFTSSDCSKLKRGVKEKTLKKFKTDLMRNVASQLLAKEYDTEYRTNTYKAYPSTKELERTIKLGSGFSKYENITGIYLEKGTNVVFVGDMKGKEISLLIPNFMRKPAEGIEPTKDPNGWGLHKQVIKLKEGINIFEVKVASNTYISYFDDYAEKAPGITVNFPTGKINGYFDLAKHDNEDWNNLLDNAVSPIMDARGTHMQVAYPIESFQKNTRGKGVELLSNYDQMLHHHYTILGLVKYKKIPKNRMFARVNWNYYMFRDGDGVAYLGNESTMRMVSNPAVVIKGDPCWGFCHEAGHALQMRQITWPGMTETSVNIFSMYTKGKMGNDSRLKRSGAYEKAYEHYIESGNKPAYLTSDVFERLVPLWQLHLYFQKNGYPDFYPDVMEAMRNIPNPAKTRDEGYKNQLNFTKICSDVTKTDLTDFFEKYGFFWSGEMELNDYGKAKYVIPQAEVDETKAYIASKNYKKPILDITTMRE